MDFCSCRPRDIPVNTAGVVEAVRDGCSTVKDYVAKTGAGTNCHSCVPTLVKLKPTMAGLAKERDASGPGWPRSDQFETAKKAVNKAAW